MSGMTTAELQRVREIFEAALDRPPEDRQAWLDSACDGDEAVRAQVEKLLAAHNRAVHFLDAPPFAGPPIDSAGENIKRRIGSYEIICEIGQGGMSTVFLAERADGVYHKQVALKLLWPGLQSANLARRFQQERQILAQLEHPNITRLLDGGATEEGWPYLVMEYVDGLPVTRYCDERGLSLDQRLRLFQTVCGAVEYAHGKMVIHRDLKPNNILVTADGTVKLLDFGIAKLLKPDTEAEAATLTQTAMRPMTPDYASPEQVRGEDVSPASDVYSLGVILYELLIGARPYRIKSPLLHDITRAICEVEPDRPSRRVAELSRSRLIFIADQPDKLRRQLTGDLDNIVMTALSKETTRRYQSPAELSADIARRLDNRPIAARRRTFGYLAGKFIRRNKTAFRVATLVLFVALVAALWRLHDARQREQRERPRLYAASLRQAAEACASGYLAGCRTTLESHVPEPGGEERRGFEWRYLWRLARREQITLPHQREVNAASFSPDEKMVYTFSSDARIVTAWDVSDGKKITEFTSPDSKGQNLIRFLGARAVLINLEAPAVQMLDLSTGQTLARCVDPSASFRWAEISGIGRSIWTISHDGTVKLLDLATCRPLTTFKASPAPIVYRMFINEQRLLTVHGGQTMQLWDLARARLIATLRQPAPYLGLGYSGGQFFCLILDGGLVRIYESATGRLLATLRAAPQGNTIRGITFSPDLRRLAAFGEGRATIWDTVTYRRLGELASDTESINSAAFIDGGKKLLTANVDGTFKLWDLGAYREIKVIKAHEAEINRVAVSPDGRRIATPSSDRTAKLWDVNALLEPEIFRGHQSQVFSVAFSPDGSRLATASRDRTARVWDVATGKELLKLGDHKDQVIFVTFSPDGRLIATPCWDGVVRLWDAATGKLLRRLTSAEGLEALRAVAFSPDGRTLAAADQNGVARLWDVTSGQERLALRGHASAVFSIVFSPDGRTLASGSEDGVVKLWDAATGQFLYTINAHQEAAWSVKFSPDGRLLATGSRDRTAKLWELATRRTLVTFTGHVDEIFSVAFSPDGKRLATASNDKTIKIWETATGLELLTLKDHTDQVWSVAFSPDGQTLASGSWDKTARLWRSATKEEVKASGSP